MLEYCDSCTSGSGIPFSSYMYDLVYGLQGGKYNHMIVNMAHFIFLTSELDFYHSRVLFPPEKSLGKKCGLVFRTAAGKSSLLHT